MGDKFQYKCKLSKNKLNILYNRQHGKCIYCNYNIDLTKEKGKHWNIEHIIPRVVFKWTEHKLSKDESHNLFKLHSSMDNLALAHYKCNIQKDSSIIKYKDINNMEVDEQTKQKYIEILDNSKKYINLYNDIRNRLYNKQHKRCAICKQRLIFNTSVLRRKDDTKDRTEDNGILICQKCSYKIHRIRRKI